MSALTVSFSAGLAYKFEPLLKVFEEHLDDNSGEILPHLLIAGFCRKILQSSKPEKWHFEFFDYLEANYSAGDDLVSELVAVSFIEHLPAPQQEGYWTVSLLGRKLKRQYNRIFLP